MKYFLLLLTLLSTSTFGANSSLNYGTLGIGATQLVNATNWVSSSTFITPSAGFGTVASPSYQWRQVGDTIQVRGTFVNGTVAASTASLSLPSGYVLDTTKLSSQQQVGFISQLRVGAGPTTVYGNGDGSILFYDGSSNTQLFLAYQMGTNIWTKYNVSTNLNSSATMTFEFTVPIVGLTAAGGGAPNSAIFFAGASNTSACGSSPCTIYSSPNSYVSSVTRTGTGSYTINFPSGTFSGTPICTCSGDGTINSVDICLPKYGASSATAVSIITSNSGTGNVDSGVFIQCSNPK